MWGGTAIEALIAVAAALTAAGVVYHRALKPIVLAAKRLVDVLEWVNREMRPNGGSSMRDAVDRIEADVLGLADRVGNLEQLLKGDEP